MKYYPMLEIFTMNCITFTKKYNKEINSLNTKNRENLDYKKLRLSDDLYSSEEEQEEKTITDANASNEQIIKEETNINTKLFTKHFNFPRPSDILNFLDNLNDINKNSELVNVVISRLKELKKEIKDMSKEERENEQPDKIVKIVEDFLRFNKKNKKDKA